MARGGHRKLSVTTKLKIAASLKGNKNAYRGGPKKRLTTRQQVANINARSKANKAKLSDAQLRQRQSVAKRLRARARSEEAGISPNHTKAIPSPAAEDKSPKSLESKARVHGAVNRATVKKDPASAPIASGRHGSSSDVIAASKARRDSSKSNAARYEQMHGTKGLKTKLGALESRKSQNADTRSQIQGIKAHLANSEVDPATEAKEIKKGQAMSAGKSKIAQGFLTLKQKEEITALQQANNYDSVAAGPKVGRYLAESRARIAQHKAAADRSKPQADPLQLTAAQRYQILTKKENYSHNQAMDILNGKAVDTSKQAKSAARIERGIASGVVNRRKRG